MPPRNRRTGPLSIQGETQAHVQESLFASPADGAAFIEHLPEQYRICREGRHYYQAFRVEQDRATKTLLRIRRCACGTEHHQLLSTRDGRVLEPAKIRYPSDYLAKGIGRLQSETYGLLRLEAVRREIAATGGEPLESQPVRRSRRQAS